MIHKTGMYKAEIIINNLGISDTSKQNCEISIFLNRQLCATTNLKEDFCTLKTEVPAIITMLEQCVKIL